MKKRLLVTPAIFLTSLIFNACASAVNSTPVFTPKKSETLLPATTSQNTKTPPPTPLIYPTHIYHLLTSPDGTKKVQSYTYEGKTLDVIGSDGKVLWSFAYDDSKFGSDYTNMLGEAGYSPFYWSKDGKYIYSTSYHRQEIDTSTKFYGNEFIDGCGVARLNVDTGEMEDILPEITPGHGYYAFSISPDERHLVYTNQAETPVKIKLLNLNTREGRILLSTNEDILETGRYGWSPYSDRIVFMTLKMSEDKKRFYSIFVLDLKSLGTKLLVKDFDTRIRFVSWNEQDVISYEPDDSSYIWQLSVESTMFSLVTPTPWTISTTVTP